MAKNLKVNIKNVQLAEALKLKKLKETPQGRQNNNLDKIKDLLSFFESNYRQI